MSSAMLLKTFFIAFMSLILSYTVFARYDHEVGAELNDNQQRYVPYIPGELLPAIVLVILVLTLLFEDLNQFHYTVITMYFSLFIHISLFYAIILCLLPTLRKHISARAIAFLWMVPNYLYLIFYRFMVPEEPLFVIKAPQNVVKIIFMIVLGGTCVVFIASIFSHFKYRHFILKDSQEINDNQVIRVWNEELKRAHIKKSKIKLVVSPNVSTPLTVGLFRRTTRVVLPHLNYTDDELTLIFRHEIVHIGREDVWSKFFLIFCTALCWYNPLMWIAKRKCSDDLELSCDETVLIDMDESQRKKYATLILNNASSQQGFTTCLSASATALRYRLKNIMKPKKRYTGALVVGLAFFIMSMTGGFIALAYEQKTGSEVIFNNQDSSTYTISHITIYDNPYNQEIECVDVDGFHQYLSSLNLSRLTGSYSFEKEEDQRYTFIYNTPNESFGLVISDKAIKIVPLRGEGSSATYYYLLDGLDWNEFRKYIKTYPALQVDIKHEKDTYYDHVSTMLLKIEKDGQIIYGEVQVEDHQTGIYGSKLPVIAKLNFSSENVIDYKIIVHSWDYSKTYTIEQKDINEKGEFSLPNYSAHYRIYATLEDENGDIVNAEYLLNIGDSTTLIPE